MAKTSQALCAQLVRADLKAAFPSVKFAVKSAGYAGGDSVHIGWTDGPCTSKVNAIVGKYQYGHFDGMTDSYDYTNVKDIPQTKFVQTRRDISEAVNELVEEMLSASYGIDRNDSKAWMEKTHQWLSQLVWRQTSDWSEGEAL